MIGKITNAPRAPVFLRIKSKPPIISPIATNGINHEISIKAASGGEISRIMLSLKSLINDMAGVPVMVFDEIDTGISGKVARKVSK